MSATIQSLLHLSVRKDKMQLLRYGLSHTHSNITQVFSHIICHTQLVDCVCVCVKSFVKNYVKLKINTQNTGKISYAFSAEQK